MNVKGQIALNRVTFTYPGSDRPALRAINLVLPAGRTVALVGHSGSGKTTLFNLVARFYDPTLGDVSLDGRDIRDLNPIDYRKLLAIVEQDVTLFDDTIGANIAYGVRGATQAKIEDAARAANAHDFISSFPRGYDSHVGERGVQLSGGQRQRIAIARALLVNPKVLLLDEATSSVDSESEQAIQESLERLLEGRTALVIAHRMSSLLRADHVVVLEEGRILEQGAHRKLFELDGYYRKMVEMQANGWRPYAL